MARKKKVVTEEPKTKSGLAIGYSGNIKLSLRSGKTVISTKVYNNHGGLELFKFLGYCLAGAYTAADPVRPIKVGLYYNTASTPSTAKIDTGMSSASILVTTNTAATIEEVAETATDSAVCKVTLHFVIPKIYITGSAFNQVVLYGADVVNTAAVMNGTYSAIFNLTANGDNWATVDTASWADNYNLVLEWEMSLKND